MNHAHAATWTDEDVSWIVGVDLGGTTTKVGRLARGGTALQGFGTRPTGADRSREAVLGDVAEEIRAQATAAGDVAAVGIAIPAAMTPDGRIDVLPNFAPGWRGLDLADEVQRATGHRTVVVNDARAFALAEARVGAAVGARSAFGVTLGTGVGGGIVLNGTLYLGANGNAGEFGHHTYDPHGPLCGCGSHGCVETYASAPALVASVMRPFAQGRTPRLRELAGDRFDGVTPARIAEAAEVGDAHCRDAIDRVAEVLGVGLADVTTLLGVDRIVVGGGMAGMGDTLLAPLRRTLTAYASTVGGMPPEVMPARLGTEAGALGAALHALDVVRHAA
ncbi:MAG: ROK family protein [Trueperaceae bacterium]|nr:ROK family protein [Trueperaceae bacterium]